MRSEGRKTGIARVIRNLLVAISTFVFVSFGSAAESPKWQAEWQKTIDGAKKEGQLSLYGGQEITHPDITSAFSKEFPFIKIISASGRAADMMTRIVAERRADKYLADLTASGPNGPRMLYLNKILDPLAPTLILPEVTDPSKWYGGKHWYADPENKYIFMFEGTIVTTGLSVNTKLVSAGEIKSYWDLLQPKWKGKLLGQDPRGAALLTPVLILYHRAGLGPDFVRRLYTETDITLFRDRRQGTNWLATGKFPVCHLCREIDKAAQQGLPVEDIRSGKIEGRRNNRRRRQQRAGIDQSRAPSERGKGFHQLVFIPPRTNSLAERDEQEGSRSVGFHAHRYLERRRVGRRKTSRGPRISSDWVSRSRAGAEVAAGDFEVRRRIHHEAHEGHEERQGGEEFHY